MKSVLIVLTYILLLISCGEFPTDSNSDISSNASDSPSNADDENDKKAEVLVGDEETDPADSSEIPLDNSGTTAVSRAEADGYLSLLESGVTLDSLSTPFKKLCKDALEPSKNSPAVVLCAIYNFDEKFYYALSFCDNGTVLFANYEGETKQDFIFFDPGVCETNPVSSSGDVPAKNLIPPATANDFFIIGYDIFNSGYTEYLGCWSCNEYDIESIHNTYGTYGSKYSTDSIRNNYSNWGGKYGGQSACNQYAANPPLIVDGDGVGLAYLSIDTIDTDSICSGAENNICELLKLYCAE